MSAESDFNKARQQALSALETHEAQAIDRALGILDSLRLTIIARLAESQLQVNDVAAFRSVQLMLDGALMEFQRRLSEQIKQDLQAGVEAAARLVDEPIARLGLNPSQLPLNPVSIEAAGLFALDRVKGLTADARDAISSILRRVLGGAISVNDGIREVGASLNSKGIFKSFAARAELIVRQEILTVQSQVAQARMELRAAQMSSAGYELRKAWLTAHDLRVRPAHVEAGTTYDKENSIPVDESFTVDDEDLLYPRDPSGSPENVINCRCVAMPVVIRAA